MANYFGSIYSDTIWLSSANDIAYGFGGNDFISDQREPASSDFMFGGDGADTLVSWGGVDTLDGGNGHDIFEFHSDVDNIRIVGGAGNDTLKVNPNLFMPGEFEALDELADSGAAFALRSGGVLIIEDVEVIWAIS